MNFALEFSLKKNVRLNLCITSISGIKANISVGEDLINAGCNVKVINLSDGYDPDADRTWS